MKVRSSMKSSLTQADEQVDIPINSSQTAAYEEVRRLNVKMGQQQVNDYGEAPQRNQVHSGLSKKRFQSEDARNNQNRSLASVTTQPSRMSNSGVKHKQSGGVILESP